MENGWPWPRRERYLNKMKAALSSPKSKRMCWMLEARPSIWYQLMLFLWKMERAFSQKQFNLTSWIDRVGAVTFRHFTAQAYGQIFNTCPFFTNK